MSDLGHLILVQSGSQTRLIQHNQSGRLIAAYHSTPEVQNVFRFFLNITLYFKLYAKFFCMFTFQVSEVQTVRPPKSKLNLNRMRVRAS